uniref:Uncharacterized protein n=1 Tax=Acrobeloides nanus TaxID=290746 RepID=A0A914CWR2_9BILA
MFEIIAWEMKWERMAVSNKVYVANINSNFAVASPTSASTVPTTSKSPKTSVAPKMRKVDVEKEDGPIERAIIESIRPQDESTNFDQQYCEAVFAGIPITNNAVERFHLTFKDGLHAAHPTLGNFLEAEEHNHVKYLLV